jgi:hypothetical protein
MIASAMSEPLPPPSREPPSNAIGLAGFVVSLVGIISCGALSPIGLILSLIGLRKEPKGLAVAGTIIGGVGIVLLGVLVGLVVILIPRGQVAATEAVVMMAERAIEARAAETGDLPSVDEGKELIAEHTDAWGNPLRYEPSGDEFTIRSAGPDGAFDTADDIVSSGERWLEDDPPDGG